MPNCELKYRGKKRSGENRYWCIIHSKEVLTNNFMCPVSCDTVHSKESFKSFEIDLNDWPGGVGIWGAMPPIFSTHKSQGHQTGIHIHTRRDIGGVKINDGTYDELRLYNGTNLFGEDQYITINLETALSYTASNVFGVEMKCLVCPSCETFHSDEGIFAVNAHRKHLCTNCGKNFVDKEHGVSNPIVEIKSRLLDGKKEYRHKMSEKELIIDQQNFPGGIQIWGSNPAILWSAEKSEEIGIHVHVYENENSEKRIYDDTYGSVIIDGYKLDHNQVRYFMVQRYLDDILGFVKYFECSHCKHPHFDKFEMARTPHSSHLCLSCEKEFTYVKSIGNPIVKILDELYSNYNALQK